MSMGYTNWRHYERATATALRHFGWKVKVGATVQGARSAHRVDVYGQSKFGGFECRCLVECKYWRRKVPKSVVLAFDAIVSDVGANFGLIVCEKGFQRGALQAAEHTVIRLVSSLQDLEQWAVDLSKKTNIAGESKKKKITRVVASLRPRHWCDTLAFHRSREVRCWFPCGPQRFDLGLGSGQLL